MTSAPGGGAPVPIETMRSSVTRMTALAIAFPAGSIALPARRAFVAAEIGAARSRIMISVPAGAGAELAPPVRVWPGPLPRSRAGQGRPLRLHAFILRSRFLDLSGDLAREPLGREHADEGPEAQNPAR